jgi:putative Mg2+ transporter-C (MgtC) family protein
MIFITNPNIQFLLRMFVACLCGITIGVERKNRAKEAGIRTHCVVACASALMMIISKYGFFDIADADGSRIASQVVSGIGFLGAGLIFVQKQTVKGLTTAAGIWATSGIGLALGAGMYFVGISATALILIVQYAFHANFKFLQSHKIKIVSVLDVTEENFQKNALAKFKTLGIAVSDVEIQKKSETNSRTYFFTAEIPPSVSEEEIINLFNEKCFVKSSE